MTGWLAFAVTLVIAISLALALKRRSDAELEALRERSRAEVSELKTEARGRVDRIEREAGRTRYDARDDLFRELLPALDSLRLARDQVVDEEARRGLGLVIDEFMRALTKQGVENVAPAPGDEFDPGVHEAVETMESTELMPGSIGRCHRHGYRTSDRILRPALVAVVRNSAELADDAASETGVAD